MALLGRFLGVNLFSKAVASLLLLGEAAVPIYLIFQHRLEKLGRQLFDTTLQMKLGNVAAGSHLQPVRAAPGGAINPPQLRQPSVSPLHDQDRQVLASMVHKQRQQAAAQAQRSLAGSMLSACFSLAVRVLLKPRPNEGWLIRKTRDFATLGTAALVPGAALLLPLAVYRDSGVEVANLMRRYWEVKGVSDPDAQDVLVQQRMGDLRGFGLMATGLSYVPVLNWALDLSNHVAAALYAAHVEKKGGQLLRRGWL